MIRSTMKGLSRCMWVVAVAAALAGCSDAEHPPEELSTASPKGGRASAPPAAPAPSWDTLQARVQARLDSVDTALRQVRALTRAEQRALRRDVNRVQTARARAMGINPTAEIDPLVASGQLVPLEDSTRLWVLRDLDYSVPYVTPSTHAMLVEIGERFQTELDSLGLPPIRLVVTSVLRSSAMQAKLRRSNPNAARGVSAHQYGTTLDVAYRRFAPPAPSVDTVTYGAPPQLEPQLRQLQDSLFVETGTQRSAELQAVLGRVLQKMRDEGKLLVMMERAQTVYHMTVAKKLQPRPVALAR
ncbi:MAG: hypothetical protein KY464_09070 [Gemmatimonadetes bacterium]|nr:hypothetical protein [Gemmatimonadota bacterium]